MKLTSLLISTAALFLVVTAPAAQYELSPLWSLAGGSRAYLTDTGHLQRGLAYNPATGHLLVVDRGALAIYILDSVDGSEVGTLDLSAMQSGGNSSFKLNLIGVADDGIIYAANLSNSTSAPHVNLYAWLNETSVQEVVFQGDPGMGNIQRWGDTMDVRGGGTDTQILLGSRGNVAAVFTTVDGFNFFPKLVTIDSLPGSLGFAVAFGEANSFWGTSGASTGGPLRLFSYHLEEGIATTLQTYEAPVTPGRLTPLDIDPQQKLLAALVIDTPDRVDLFDISNPQSAPVLFDSEAWPSDVANNVFAGSVQMTSNRVFVLNNNNGIVAYELIAATETAPEIVVGPESQSVPTGSDVRFQVGVRGATPMSYNWFRNDQLVTGATNSSLVIANVQAQAVGSYKVEISNAVGATTSETVQLTLTDPPPPSRLEPLWTIIAGTRPYITLSGSSQRGMAYNHVTDHVLIPNRAGGVSIPILDGETGEDLGALDSAFIGGGSVSLTQMGVADDGAIYACNLTTTSTIDIFKIYRWADETALWTEAFFDISSIEPQRWGDTMDVRGSGAATQILLGSGTGGGAGTGTTVALLTTETGTNFTVTQLVADAPAFSFSHGVAFGEGDTFWGTSRDGNVYLMSFDRTAGTATTIRSYEAPFPAALTAIDLDVPSNLLAGVTASSPDEFLLFEVATDRSSAELIASAAFPSDNANSTATGSVDFGRDKVFAYDTNNGLMAFRIAPEKDEAPPQLSIRISGQQVVLFWPASAAGFSLEMSGDVGTTASWSSTNADPVSEGDNLTVTISPGEAPAFFRLKK